MILSTIIWNPDRPELSFTETSAHIIFRSGEGSISIILPLSPKDRETGEALAHQIVTAFDRYRELSARDA